MTEKVTNPVRYELVNKFGRVGGTFETADRAVKCAQDTWPDQVQDEDRSGFGWDIQVVGS